MKTKANRAGRYEIQVRRQQKLIDHRWFNDYDAAMLALDEIEAQTTYHQVTVEFIDHEPFKMH